MTLQKISLGTAQWGLNYGVSNLKGKTNSSEAYKMLSYSTSLGINHIDTALLYGDAELILGNYENLQNFKITTKTKKVSKSKVTKSDSIELINAFKDSLGRLKVSSVHGLLIHNASDILVEGGEFLIEALNQIKSQNKAKNIGVSIYDSKNLLFICDQLKPDVVQLPLNILDQRFIKDGSLDFLKKKGIKIQVRSVFLQGLLFYNNTKFPIYFKRWKKILEKWQKSCQDQKFSPIEAALSFIVNIKEIDHCIVGFENINQLKECTNFFKKKNLKLFDASNLDCDDIELINPTNWKT